MYTLYEYIQFIIMYPRRFNIVQNYKIIYKTLKKCN